MIAPAISQVMMMVTEVQMMMMVMGWKPGISNTIAGTKWSY
jgi:hypothetical protein